MSIEFEAKILDIDPSAISDLILSLGGQRIGEKFMRRYVYDIVPSDIGRHFCRDTKTSLNT